MAIPPRERVELVVKTWENTGSLKLAAEAAGIAARTVENWLKASERWYGIIPQRKADQSEPEPLVARQERIIADLRKQLAEVKAEVLTDKEVLRVLDLGKDSSTPEWVSETFTHQPGTPGIPITMWSDWHWGEVVRPEEVGGANSFNLEVAQIRVKALVDSVHDLCMNHMINPQYPGIVVCLGGDMISGDIHEELARTNALDTAPALLDLQGVLIGALTKMADSFGRVFVPCVVGNHGRMTAKPRAKSRVHTSYEWLLYCQLERHFKNDPRFKFKISSDTDVVFSVYGHKYLLTHGDSLGVKGGDGIIGAIGPIMRGTVKLRNSEKSVGREFDTVIMGHWHQSLFLPGAIVNNALKGYDEYARTFLRVPATRPSQALWFTHPKRGITFATQVYVDQDKTPDHSETDGGWVSWKE